MSIPLYGLPSKSYVAVTTIPGRAGSESRLVQGADGFGCAARSIGDRIDALCNEPGAAGDGGGDADRPRVLLLHHQGGVMEFQGSLLLCRCNQPDLCVPVPDDGADLHAIRRGAQCRANLQRRLDPSGICVPDAGGGTRAGPIQQSSLS